MLAESDELSSSQLGLLVGHLESVFAALAQFQDWRVFSENAVAADIDADSVRLLANSAKAIAKELSGAPAVDPSVTVALTTVSEWAEGQEKPDRRDVLSLARTLENMWSAIVKEALALRGEVVAKARALVAAGIVTALVAASAASLPVLRKIPGAQWIESAYTYFTTNPVLPPK